MVILVSEEEVMVNGEKLADVDSFVPLVVEQMMTSRAVFGKLMGVWKSSILSKSTKMRQIRIFKSNRIATLLYGCESWRVMRTNLIPFSTKAYAGFINLLAYICVQWRSAQKSQHWDLQRASKKKEVDMDRARAVHEQQFTPASCPHMGTRRENI